VLSSAQLAFLTVVAVATLAFLVAGAILGRVAISQTERHEVYGDRRAGLPQIVITAPLMVLVMVGTYWLSFVSLPAVAVVVVALLLASRLLNRRQPHAEELRQRRSRLNVAMTRHPAAVWGFRVLFAAYVAAVAVAAILINPRP
jgi:hypothetical protein